MLKEGSKVKYIRKSSVHGKSPIPEGTEGVVLLYVEHHETVKLLVDFNKVGKVIIPLSAVEVV